MLVDIIVGVILLFLVIDIAQIRRKINKVEQIEELLETQKKINDKMQEFTSKLSKTVAHIAKRLDEE